MPGTPRGDDERHIARIREAWERFDNTGEATEIADHLADDVVLLPPGAPPITGKAAVMEGVTGSGDNDIEQSSENLVVSGDLAVDWIGVRTARDSPASDVSDDTKLQEVDVYRRDENGTWKLIIAIWNNQT